VICDCKKFKGKLKMNINSLNIDPGEAIFYSKAFMDTMESHVGYFRKSLKSNIVQIDQGKAAVYVGDFFGYLSAVGIEAKYHWLFMRINGYYNSNEFTIDKFSLILPDKNEIEQIRSSFVSTGLISL
jgi:hypothetical protein